MRTVVKSLSGSCDLLAKLVSVFIKEMRFLSSVDYHYKLYALFVG